MQFSYHFVFGKSNLLSCKVMKVTRNHVTCNYLSRTCVVNTMYVVVLVASLSCRHLVFHLAIPYMGIHIFFHFRLWLLAEKRKMKLVSDWWLKYHFHWFAHNFRYRRTRIRDFVHLNCGNERLFSWKVIEV